MFWVGVGKSEFFVSEIYFWCIGQVIHFEHDRALFKSELQDFLDEHSQQHITTCLERSLQGGHEFRDSAQSRTRVCRLISIHSASVCTRRNTSTREHTLREYQKRMELCEDVVAGATCPDHGVHRQIPWIS